MITKEFVQKYLNIKDLLKCKAITGAKYTALILNLCDKYKVDPAILAEYNMDIEPRKIIV
jgi:hypothetical protein